MKNVLSFQKTQAKKALVSFSVVMLILGALLLNETHSRSVRPLYLISANESQIETLNRAIASAQPMNPFADLQWEKALAEKLSQPLETSSGSVNERAPASVGQGVSPLDQLLFGPLAGKYRLQNKIENTKVGDSSAKIKDIEYVPSSEANDRPVILNLEHFLRDYGSLLSVKFEAFDKANPNQTNVREYRLLNGEKKVVGMAAFFVDDEGRLRSLKVREAAIDSSF